MSIKCIKVIYYLLAMYKEVRYKKNKIKKLIETCWATPERNFSEYFREETHVLLY